MILELVFIGIFWLGGANWMWWSICIVDVNWNVWLQRTALYVDVHV
jgi:hypothetical protein